MISEQDAYEIDVEAYTYLYPLVLMDTTRRQAVNVEAGKAFGRGPMNVFTHVPIFPPADFRDEPSSRLCCRLAGTNARAVGRRGSETSASASLPH
jgi:hypothetical protein